MKVAVLGCKGMLGTDVMDALGKAGFEAVGLDLPELDIADYHNVRERMPAVECAINCAAYTKVDDAEIHRKEAFAVNAEGALHVARVCTRRRIRLVHISTDYIFDGGHPRAYSETDTPDPISVYGASKFAGEKAVREEGGRFLVVRTESLFGVHGPNFVRAIVRKLKAGDEPVRVVNDQTSSPTYTRHLADALIRLLRLDKNGVVNVAASGECTWFDFARAIADRVKPGAAVEAITAAELARPAPRPKYSVLDTHLYRMWTGQRLPSWEKGLDEYLAEEGFA